MTQEEYNQQFPQEQEENENNYEEGENDEQNKKNLLQKFYSLSNINPPTIPNTQQSPQSQFQVQNKE